MIEFRQKRVIILKCIKFKIIYHVKCIIDSRNRNLFSSFILSEFVKIRAWLKVKNNYKYLLIVYFVIMNFDTNKIMILYTLLSITE